MPLIPTVFDATNELSKEFRSRVSRGLRCGEVVADVRHRVLVRMLAAEQVWLAGAMCDAIFYFDDATAEIWLACRKRTVDSVLRSAAHELIHYKQWRDGIEQSEPEADGPLALEIFHAMRRAAR